MILLNPRWKSCNKLWRKHFAQPYRQHVTLHQLHNDPIISRMRTSWLLTDAKFFYFIAYRASWILRPLHQSSLLFVSCHVYFCWNNIFTDHSLIWTNSSLALIALSRRCAIKMPTSWYSYKDFAVTQNQPCLCFMVLGSLPTYDYFHFRISFVRSYRQTLSTLSTPCRTQHKSYILRLFSIILSRTCRTPNDIKKPSLVKRVHINVFHKLCRLFVSTIGSARNQSTKIGNWIVVRSILLTPWLGYSEVVKKEIASLRFFHSGVYKKDNFVKLVFVAITTVTRENTESWWVSCL